MKIYIYIYIMKWIYPWCNIHFNQKHISTAPTYVVSESETHDDRNQAEYLQSYIVHVCCDNKNKSYNHLTEGNLFSLLVGEYNKQLYHGRRQRRRDMTRSVWKTGHCLLPIIWNVTHRTTGKSHNDSSNTYNLQVQSFVEKSCNWSRRTMTRYMN